MNSIEQQLRKNLAVMMVLILLGLVLIANLSTRILLETFVTDKLDLDAKQILSALDYSSLNSVVNQRLINPVYMTINSGHYYFIHILYDSGREVIIQSPSLQDKDIPAPQVESAVALHNIPGPNNDHLIVWVSTYKVEGKVVTVSVGEDMTLLKKHRRHFTLVFISAGITGVFLILFFQRISIRKAFKNLDASRIELKEVESGKLLQLSENVPSEIYPLVKEYNQGLFLMRDRLQRSRNSLGNLAHALKTPLNVLLQYLDQFKEINSDTDDKLIPKMIIQAERIRQLTERELKRAGIAGLGNSSQRFNPYEELPVLIDVLRQSHCKNDLKVELEIAQAIDVFGDREDMLELIGNLMDNAFKWADVKINCTLSKASNNIVIIIEDDGPGRETQELKSLASRGVRLDETIEGYGLGLAICKDIVKLYAGSINFMRSENLEGFLVEIKLPIIK